MSLSDKCRMTWEASKRRWRKMHRGKVFTVSCETLGVPPTKEQSYRAANAWWAARLAELTLHPHQGRLDQLARRKDWAERHGDLATARLLGRQIAEVTGLDDRDDPPPDDPSEGIATARLFGIAVPDDLDPTVADHFFGAGRVWADRLRRDSESATPNDTTVGTLAQTWIDAERSKAEAGLLRPRSFDNNRVNCLHFSRFVGESIAPTTINEKTIDDYYNALLRKVAEGLSASNARERMKVALRFVRWLWERRAIERPRNLDRSFPFGVTAPVIVTFTPAEVRTLLDSAKGQNRLHILLMVNCGYYPGDIAALRDEEVDWSGGSITRKRSKTRTQKTVPTVTYPLWGETARLLREHRSGGPIVLLNSKGRPWIRESVKPDGRVSVSDTLSVSLDAVLKRSGIAKPLKSLRKTGASLLETKPEFARFGPLYLGHAPRSIADKHYTAPYLEGFSEAIRWLETALF